MPWDSAEDEPLIEQHAQAPDNLSSKGAGIDSSARRALNIEEWTDRVMILRNIAIVFLAVMLFQIPFELLYAAFSQKCSNTIAKLFSISCYLFCIQKFKVIGGKLAVRLNNAQAHVSSEAAADSLIYKVFWIYFVQSYIGVFYHAFVLQDFKLLRQTLIDRMLVAQVINNVMESLVPYVSYLYASRRTYNSERKEKKANGEKVTEYSTSRVEKEFLKPRYITNIADNQHEGLFDDYLELALQFGIVVMFASFFPLVAVLALLNNLVEIRSDSFKLLKMMKRPVPHVVGSIGAWLHIFQYLSGAAIVSNCFLLLLMFDKDGEWRMDPGLVGVLVLEHALLAARFGLSWFVPEVPAWVKAKRRKRRRMQEGYSLHVLRSISKKMLSSKQSI